jgi:hypothetical protein
MLKENYVITKLFIMLKDNYVILFVLICPIQDDLSMDGENPSRLSLGLHVGEHIKEKLVLTTSTNIESTG